MRSFLPPTNALLHDLANPLHGPKVVLNPDVGSFDPLHHFFKYEGLQVIFGKQELAILVLLGRSKEREIVQVGRRAHDIPSIGSQVVYLEVPVRWSYYKVAFACQDFYHSVTILSHLLHCLGCECWCAFLILLGSHEFARVLEGHHKDPLGSLNDKHQAEAPS